MSTIIRFASLHDSQIAYTVHADWGEIWDSAYRLGTGNFLALFAGQYDTYGDGLTQHSMTHAAATDKFTDYLGSLAHYVVEHPEDADVMRVLSERWPSPVSVQTVLFFHSIRFKSKDKPQWYNPQDRKTSSAGSKAHDRRWEIVPEWADESVEAVLRLFRGTESGLQGVVDTYALADRIRHVIAEQTGDYGTPAWRIVFPQHESGCADPYYHANQAFDAVNLMVEGYRQVQHGKRTLECYLSNTASRRKFIAQASTDDREEVAS